MVLEAFLSVLVALLCVVLAWTARRSLVAIHLLPLGLLCVMLPSLQYILGRQPEYESTTTILVAYGSVGIYGTLVCVTAMILRDRSLARLGQFVQAAPLRDLPIQTALLALGLLWLLRLYTGLGYGLLVSGSGTEETIRSIPYWLVVAVSVGAMFGKGSLVILTIAALRQRMWFWFLIALEGIWTLLSHGRREALFIIVLVGLLSWHAGKLRRTGAWLAVAAPLVALYLLTPFFLVGRAYNADNLAAGVTPLVALTDSVKRSFHYCEYDVNCSRLVTTNVAERGNAMLFIKEIVRRTATEYSYLNGEGCLNAVAWATPSVFTEKPSLMTEQLVQASIGSPLGDDAISLPALAYADFGLAGSVVGGVFVALFTFSLAQVALRTNGALFRMSILASLMSLLWNIEGEPLSYFVLARNVAIVLACAFIWHLMSYRFKATRVKRSDAIRSERS